MVCLGDCRGNWLLKRLKGLRNLTERVVICIDSTGKSWRMTILAVTSLIEKGIEGSRSKYDSLRAIEKIGVVVKEIVSVSESPTRSEEIVNLNKGSGQAPEQFWQK